MTALYHIIALSAALILLLAQASGYTLQQPANTNGLTEDFMERPNEQQRFTLDDLLNYLNQRYETRPDKRAPRTTGLNAIDSVKGMYSYNKFNKLVAALQSHVSRR